MKKIIMTSVVLLSLIFSGCSSSGTTGNTTTGETQELQLKSSTIEETVLYDEAEAKITAKSIEQYRSVIRVILEIENKTNDDIEFSQDTVSINGYYNNFREGGLNINDGRTVPANSTEEGMLIFNGVNFALMEDDILREFGVSFEMSVDGQSMGSTPFVTVQTSAYEGNKEPEGIVIVDNDDLKVTAGKYFANTDLNHDIDAALLWIENKTDVTNSYGFYYKTINGVNMASYLSYLDLPAHTSGIYAITGSEYIDAEDDYIYGMSTYIEEPVEDIGGYVYCYSRESDYDNEYFYIPTYVSYDSEGNPSEGVLKKDTISNIPTGKVYDENGYTFTIDEYAENPYGDDHPYFIDMTIENTTDQTGYLDSLTINGVYDLLEISPIIDGKIYDLDYPNYDYDIEPNTTSKIRIYLDGYYLKFMGVTKFNNISFRFYESDDARWDDDLSIISLDADDGDPYEETGEILYSENGITMRSVGKLVYDNDIYVVLYIQNDTNENAYVDKDNFTNNGENIDSSIYSGYYGTTVYANTKEYHMIDVYGVELEKFGFEFEVNYDGIKQIEIDVSTLEKINE